MRPTAAESIWLTGQKSTRPLKPVLLRRASNTYVTAWIRVTKIEVKLAELGDGSAAGVIVFTDATLFRWRSSILETSLRYRLPTVCHQWLAWAEAGCLVTYGEEASAMARRVAAQVDKVLKGTKVGGIPVERPSAFKLILNAKTAKALDLQLPLSLLALADEVIE
jgi:putative ABC transport system substrate-binding protein